MSVPLKRSDQAAPLRPEASPLTGTPEGGPAVRAREAPRAAAPLGAGTRGPPPPATCPQALCFWSLGGPFRATRCHVCNESFLRRVGRPALSSVRPCVRPRTRPCLAHHGSQASGRILRGDGKSDGAARCPDERTADSTDANDPSQ